MIWVPVSHGPPPILFRVFCFDAESRMVGGTIAGEHGLEDWVFDVEVPGYTPTHWASAMPLPKGGS